MVGLFIIVKLFFSSFFQCVEGKSSLVPEQTLTASLFVLRYKNQTMRATYTNKPRLHNWKGNPKGNGKCRILPKLHLRKHRATYFSV